MGLDRIDTLIFITIGSENVNESGHRLYRELIYRLSTNPAWTI